MMFVQLVQWSPLRLTALELGHQAKDITKNPYLGDLVPAEPEHRGAGILNPSSRCRDVKKARLDASRGM
jgi:hypothetical protein